MPFKLCRLNRSKRRWVFYRHPD